MTRLTYDEGASREKDSRTAAKAVGPHHRPRLQTDAERTLWRRRSAASLAAKRAAATGQIPPIHELNVPKLDPYELMPQCEPLGVSTLSLFSGGGGLDLGFGRAGFQNQASFEILSDAADTLRAGNIDGQIFAGEAGDVTGVEWRQWRGIDVIHGGPPCQPFSVAGRQQGRDDERDLWPAFVDCVQTVRPRAFVAENVPALASQKFANYVNDQILTPLGRRYHIVPLFVLRAEDFGVPQSRRRVIFVGFSRASDAHKFGLPQPTHIFGQQATLSETARCYGAREALGLPETGYDALSPTIRSSLSGQRHTTSILNSTAAQRAFGRLEIWPNGVAPTREAARAFPPSNGHFRLSVADVGVLQGFPDDWPFRGATYMQLGQIGNAVPPPLAYAVAGSLSAALA